MELETGAAGVSHRGTERTEKGRGAEGRKQKTYKAKHTVPGDGRTKPAEG